MKLQIFQWRRLTTVLLIGGFLLVVLVAGISFAINFFSFSSQVIVGSGVYNVKIAKDDESRQRGLSGLSSLPSREGLLMIFDSSDKYSIWMKDMNFSIDIVWLDSNKEVVNIVKNADYTKGEQAVYTPVKPAKYILEIPAGSVQDDFIRIGSKAQFSETETLSWL